jgi:tetratricopeptide (TPR) repeat protein
MLRSSKICSLVLILLFSFNISSAQDKRGIGLFPFENLSKEKKYEWISFGFDYLLSNKLSNIAAYYVPEKNVINKALANAGYGKRKIDGEMVYHVGKSAGINIGISGTYYTNGTTLTVNVSFVNAFNGATIFSKEYNNSFSEMFFISDDIIKNIIDLSTVSLSQNEQNILDRQITNSVKAFEYFSNGYIENEKPSRQREVVIGLFRNAIREDPNFWEASYNLGIAYYNDQDYNKALEQFDRIIAALPAFEKPYYGRALILYRRKDYAKAKNDFQKVIKYNPNDYKPYFYLVNDFC